MKEGIGMGIHICGNATAIAEDMVETGCQYGEYGKDGQPVRIPAR